MKLALSTRMFDIRRNYFQRLAGLLIACLNTGFGVNVHDLDRVHIFKLKVVGFLALNWPTVLL